MNRKGILIGMLSAVAVVCTIAQQTNLSSSTNQTETKISELRKNGKYERTTEVFAGKILMSRKVEVSVKDNGQIDYVFTKLFRDGKMTFASTLDNAAKNTIRSYYRDGKMIFEEGDEDGDGFFETLILFDTDEQPIEAFSKNKDGVVTQFSNEKLVELKKSFAKLRE
jgi:antitoxin component YwqK of YwqJK toxin-antitoxin module